MTNNVLLEVQDLQRIFYMGEIRVEALKKISFIVNEGEFVVILGPSGSGKSTLLNIIGGMDKPTGGRVLVGGHEITAYNDRELTQYRRNQVGFVFQFYNLMANLTSRENVELATEICNNPLAIDEVLRAVDLMHREDHFPSQLSGGEQQRVAIARAVAKNPMLLLCDEPTGALDFETGISILTLLNKINREHGKTVIVITHNSPIASMADRVIRLRSGHIIEDTTNANPADSRGIVW